MPRVKHILKGKDVIQAWITQSQDWARTSSGNLSFIGEYLFNRNFENISEEDYVNKCSYRRYTSNNGGVFFVGTKEIYYRQYSDDGYDIKCMISKYARLNDNALFFNIFNKDNIYVASLRVIADVYFPYPAYVSKEYCQDTIYNSMSKVFGMKNKFVKYGLTPDMIPEQFNILDEYGKKLFRMITSEKFDMELFSRRRDGMYDFAYEKKLYDSKFGQGTFDGMISYALSKVSSEFNERVAGVYEHACNPSCIKLTTRPRVGKKN